MVILATPADARERFYRDRKRFFGRMSEDIFSRQGFADLHYPYCTELSDREIGKLIQIEEALARAVTALVENYFRDSRIRAYVPLKRKVSSALKPLQAVPYRPGLIRPDFIYTTGSRPLICEINARFILNGYLPTTLLNRDLAQKMRVSALSELHQRLENRFFRREHLILKEREPGMGIHYMLSANNRARILDRTAFARLKHNATPVILELHQDELETVLDKVVAQMLDGVQVLNDPRTVFITHDKRFLAALRDPEILRDYIPGADIKLLLNHIIPSYVPILHRSQLAEARRTKDDWVAKRAISGKTDGLYLGNETRQSEWKQCLANQDIVLQPYIKQRTFPYWNYLFQREERCNLAGTMVIWDQKGYGPGIFRLVSAGQFRYLGFSQPARSRRP